MAISNFARFSHDLPGTLSFHLDAVEYLRSVLINPNHPKEVQEVFRAQLDDLNHQFYQIESAYKKFVSNMVGHTMQQEIDKQSFELFPDSSTNMSKIHYVRLKIIYEWVSSFLKIAESAWSSTFQIIKIFSTYPVTQKYYTEMQEKYLKQIPVLNLDTKSLLTKIETKFECKIVGSFAKDKQVLVSNLIYDEGKDYDYGNLFPKQEADKDYRFKTVSKPFQVGKTSQGEEYLFTRVIGTKEWNRNDAYVLHVKSSELKEEEQKFYSSSFIIFNPSENANINLAAAMVRKNTGFSAASKYSKMVNTLLEFAFTNLFTKDFIDVCEDSHTFLYHVGPVVFWNIIQEDMQRRDFGYCYYVEKNTIIKFFPEVIIKKNIIDFWAEKFYDLKASSVDSYITYSKGVSSIKEAYKNYFDQAAATRKRLVNDAIPLEDYFRENTGKFFGHRRAQVFRRFINDTVWGQMYEVSSSDLVHRFFKK